MPLSVVATNYRDKARKCRFLANSADEKLTKQLFMLADAYEAAAYSREQKIPR